MHGTVNVLRSAKRKGVGRKKESGGRWALMSLTLFQKEGSRMGQTVLSTSSDSELGSCPGSSLSSSTELNKGKMAEEFPCTASTTLLSLVIAHQAVI